MTIIYRIIVCIILLLTLGMWPRFGSAQVEESRPITGFSRLALRGHFDLVLEQGDTPGLQLRAKNGEDLEKLTTGVNGGTLEITYRRDSDRDWGDYPRIEVKLTFTELEAIDMEGKLLIESSSTIRTGRLELSFEGYVKGGLNIDVNALDLRAEGYVRLAVSGRADQEKLNVEGYGKLKTGDLMAKAAEVSGSGMVTIYVNASESLDAHMEGLSKLGYTGNPQHRDIQKEGIILTLKRDRDH